LAKIFKRKGLRKWVLSKIIILKTVTGKILSAKDLADDFRETPNKFRQNPHAEWVTGGICGHEAAPTRFGA
jgi:hypothetical protein